MNAPSSGCYLRSRHVSKIHVSIDLSQRSSLHRIATEFAALSMVNPLIWVSTHVYPARNRNLRASVAKVIALFYNVVAFLLSNIRTRDQQVSPGGRIKRSLTLTWVLLIASLLSEITAAS